MVDYELLGLSNFNVDFDGSSYIINLSDENKRLHKKASEYIILVSKLQLETMKHCDRITDHEKVRNYMERVCRREIPTRKNVERGTLNKRFLSAVTPDGVVLQYDTIVALSEKIITIKDDYSVCAPAIMDCVADYALENGYDVYACYCPIFPTVKIEHIIIPEKNIPYIGIKISGINRKNIFKNLFTNHALSAIM